MSAQHDANVPLGYNKRNSQDLNSEDIDNLDTGMKKVIPKKHHEIQGSETAAEQNFQGEANDFGQQDKLMSFMTMALH